MATLEELIQQRKRQLGLTFRQLAQRAVDEGAKGPNWSHLATKRISEFPKVRTIHALAKALEVTPEEIAQAALESLGLHAKQTAPIDDPAEQWIIVSAAALTPEDEAVIRQKLAEAATELRGRNKTT